MDGENLKRLSSSTILIAMTLLAFTFAFAPSAKAQNAVVSVLPATVEIAAVGETQTVDINVTDVTNLYGYEIKIWYESAIVNTTVASVVRPAGHFLEPSDPTKEFVVSWAVNNAFNATHGRIYLSYTILSPETARTGNGILFRITFTGVAVGSTPIVLANYPGSSGPVKLADNTASPIVHTVTNGTINVIPEFLMLVPIFAITSLAAVAIAKLRKRKQLA
jgi:hypothetical protein